MLQPILLPESRRRASHLRLVSARRMACRPCGPLFPEGRFPNIEMIGTSVGRIRIIGLLRQGGMSEVYRGGRSFPRWLRVRCLAPDGQATPSCLSRGCRRPAIAIPTSRARWRSFHDAVAVHHVTDPVKKLSRVDPVVPNDPSVPGVLKKRRTARSGEDSRRQNTS
jgi:hypothetical protein